MEREAFPATLSRLTCLNRKPALDIREFTDPDEKRVPPELDSDNPGNVTTQNRTLGLVEFDTNSDSEKPYFSKTLGKYLAL